MPVYPALKIVFFNSSSPSWETPLIKPFLEALKNTLSPNCRHMRLRVRCLVMWNTPTPAGWQIDTVRCETDANQKEQIAWMWCETIMQDSVYYSDYYYCCWWILSQRWRKNCQIPPHINGGNSVAFSRHIQMYTLTHTQTMHLLPAGGIPKPHSAFLNHEGKGLVEAERNEMKINMAEQRLRPRTRYQSPWWKTHRKLHQIIVWNFGEWEREREKNRFQQQQKKWQLIYISINCACVAAGFGDLCMCLLSVLACVQLSTCEIIHERVSVCACACLTFTVVFWPYDPVHVSLLRGLLDSLHRS